MPEQSAQNAVKKQVPQTMPAPKTRALQSGVAGATKPVSPLAQKQVLKPAQLAKGGGEKPLGRLHAPLLVVLVACAFIALFVGYEASSATSITQCLSPNITQPVSATASPSQIPLIPVSSIVKLKLPAVDRYDRGALADLVVEATPGNGLVFVRFDSSNPLINPDTQTSLRTALEVAKKVVGEESAIQKNLFYTLSAPSDVVGGRSAGAAFTIAAIFALEGASLKENILITGAIESDGSIGAVGKILEKARAVKEAGYTVFLVPQGESKQRVPRESCREERSNERIYRECTTVSELVDVEKEVGIQVIEVKDIVEAYSLMRKD